MEQIGTETTINSGNMAGILMIVVPALEKAHGGVKAAEAQIAQLAARLEALSCGTISLFRQQPRSIDD